MDSEEDERGELDSCFVFVVKLEANLANELIPARSSNSKVTSNKPL